MKIDYKKLIPAKLPDEIVYEIGDFLCNLSVAFDDMYITNIVQYEKNIDDKKPKPGVR